MERVNTLPLAMELLPAPDPVRVFQQLAHLPYCLFLDSALPHRQLGRYSFVAADPFDQLVVPADGSDGLTQLAARLQQLPAETLPQLPPFQGGAAGLFGYELGRSLETIPAPASDPFGLPALAIAMYDVVIAFDHVDQRAWIISQGFPEPHGTARKDRAGARLQTFLQLISNRDGLISSRPHFGSAQRQWDRWAFHHAVGEQPNLYSNFNADQYREVLCRAIEYIYAGDIFQVNIAQQLVHAIQDDAVSLYLRLRQRNRATFAGYLDLGEHQIVSASPERFLCLRAGLVEARPIKGTRPRCRNPEADLFWAHDLVQSDKDRAENVMIVDLLRNDLSRVCLADSVQVTQLCALEQYAFVQHLVSVIQGHLAPPHTAVDLVRAAFPGGSITGAPKIRAMEIIAELEPTARGAYCGSLGYIGFDGSMDLSILIRTITASRGWWHMGVGGGIVAQSDPQREYEETWQKAIGMLRALQ